MAHDRYKTFLVSYRYEGAEWVVQLPARDFADAKARLARLSFATVDGELVATVPAYAGPLAAAVTAIRNAAQRLRLHT